jgi:outer membrane lipoprotein-sorting protein
MIHRRSTRGLLAAVCTAGFLALVLPAALADGLDEVLASFDEAQEAIHTLSASFVQTTTNPMLKDAIHAEGRFYMTKPDAIRWEYDTPEEMSFVIASDHYTGYFPSRGRAEKKNVQRYSKKIFRYFGMGQQSADLVKTYDLSLAEPQGESAGYHVLILEPKKRRARKRVDQVRFWLDRTSFLPMKVEYLAADGSTRVVEFTRVDVNPDLAAGLYSVEIPADVTVTSGFSGLPTLSSAE